MRMFLIGKGHLGNFLRNLWKVPDELYWTKEMMELDIATLKQASPDLIVNTAGKTDLPWCEANTTECFRCNVAAPLHVYRTIKRTSNNIPFVHISSGCVWDGPFKEDGSPFKPNDPPTPACFYSWTKAACDSMLMAELDNPLLIIRPRQVYSPFNSPRNTLIKLNGYPKLLDTPNSMTSAFTIAETIKAFCSIFCLSSQWNRIVNCYDRGQTSPFEVGSFLAEAGLRKSPEKLTKNELDVWHKPKRVDAVLKDEFFEKWINPPNVQEELKRNITLLKEELA